VIVIFSVLTFVSFTENFRQIHERVSDRLLEISPDYEQVQLNFHLTSVYDHSLHEAFSKVLHKLVDSLPYLEDLLNVFCAVRGVLSPLYLT
jgi:Ras-related GTP-binding protein C/D